MSRQNLRKSLYAQSNWFKSISSSMIVVVSLLSAVEIAHGQLSYTDPNTFLSASGAVAEAAMPSSGNNSSQVVGDMTFTNDPPSTMSWGFVDPGFTTLTPGHDLAISGVEDFNIDFGTAITSLGFDWVDVTDAQDTTFIIDFYSGGAGGTLVDSSAFSGPDNGTLLFQGFVTSQPFDRIEIREVGNDFENEVFGQFFTGALAKSWTNAGSGNWDTGTNWTGNTVPAASDHAFIAPSTSVTVTGPAAATTVSGLTVDNTSGSLTTLNVQSSGPLTVTNDLFIGQTGASAVAIPNGGTLNVGGDTNIEANGTLQLNSGATFNPTGTTNLNGGTLSVDSTSQLTGSPAFAWNSGILAVTGAGGFTATGGGPLGASVHIAAGQTLNVTNTVTNNSTIEVSGGTLVGSNIVNQAGVSFTVSGGTVTNFGTFDNTSGGITSISGGDVFVTSFDTSNGTLNFTGGSLNVDGGVFTPRTTAPGGPDFTLSGTGDPTLQIANSGSMDIDVVGGDLIVGDADDGTFNLFSGATAVNQDGFIASSSASSTGTVLVDGAGSTWTNNGTLNVGFGTTSATSDDTLTVDNDGAVVVNGTVTIGSTGAVHLDGGSITVNNGNWEREASSQFHQHHDGGTLTINNGSFESGTSTFTLGGVGRPEIVMTSGATHSAGGNGTGLIDVANGEWTVESGSVVTSESLDIFNTGAGSPGKVTVDGAGSEWNLTGTVDGTFNVGILAGGAGELVISGGGVVNAPQIRVAASDTSTGDVVVTDPNSRLRLSEGLNIDSYIGGSSGAGGVGTATVSLGGQLISDHDLRIGRDDGDGTLTVRDPTSKVTVGELGVNNDFLVVGDTGIGLLEIGDGASLETELLVVTNVSTGDGEINIGSIGGVAAPGGSMIVRGTTHIGNQNDGKLTITNGSTLSTSTGGDSRVFIGDDATSDGTSVVIDGAGSKWTHDGTAVSGADFSVGQSGGSAGVGNAVTLDITNGGALDAGGRIMIGDAGGSFGVVNVNGADPNGNVSRLDAGHDLFVGDQSEGFLNIESGGIAETQTDIQIGGFALGDGEVLVTGAGSQLISQSDTKLGDSSATTTAFGLLTIESGGTVDTGDEAQIGSLSLGNGTANVNAGGTWNANSMYVGGTSAAQGGLGLLNVPAGGLVDVATELKVWDSGAVNLSGGTIETATFDVVTPGDFNFNSGTLRFTGSKTLDTAALDDIFDSASPTLTANRHLDIDGGAIITTELRLNGGTLSVGSATKSDLDNLDWDAGTLNITDQTLTVSATVQLGKSVIVDENQNLNVVSNGSNNITVDPNSDLNVIRGGLTAPRISNNGLIVISNPSAVDFDSDNIGSGLTNNGDLVLINATTSGAIVNNGTIEIVGGGSLVETLTQGAGGTLGIDINGLASFDSLAVSGDATLDGTLDVDVSGFSLTVGDSFEILDVSGTLNGNFGGLADGSVVENFGGVNLLIDYDGGDGDDVVLFAALAGDFDFNGRVDGLDFLLWQTGGSPEPLSQSDLSDWEGNYGTTANIATSTSVPESSSLLLAAFGLLGLAVRRRLF